jgi:peptide/nickel transport system permease protein
VNGPSSRPGGDRETRLRLHVGIYRRLLVLYPRPFRRVYGRDMVQVFRDRLRDEVGTGRHRHVALFWLWAVGDLLRTAPRERVRSLIEERASAVSEGGFGMFRFIVRRVLISIPVVLLASILVFVVIRSSIDPLGGCAINPRQTPESCARLKHDLGLDRPMYVQYVTWFAHFTQGDWGKSLLSNRPVLPDIRDALANTLVLGIIATVFSLLVGVSIGVYSALRQYSLFDQVSTGGAFVGLSIPNFWFALLLQIFFGLTLTRWLGLHAPVLPIAGLYSPGHVGFDLVDRLRHLVLPMLVLAVQIIAVYSRYMRASMLEVLHSDYLRTARAKGLRERRVVVRHAMRNALIPLTTQLALDVGAIFGGLIITEQIFEYPGMGRFFINAFGRGDFQQVLPWVMVTVFAVILFNLIADIMYAVLDPRIRYA